MQNRGLYIFTAAVAAFIILTAAGGGLFLQEGVFHLQWQHRLFSGFCHQDPARSLWISGQPMAVCSRCFGIYAAFGAGWLLLPVLSSARCSDMLRTGRTAVLAVIALNFVDIVGNYFGFWQNTLYVRLAFGGLLGLAVALLFVSEFTPINKTGDDDGSTTGTTGTLYPGNHTP